MHEVVRHREAQLGLRDALDLDVEDRRRPARRGSPAGRPADPCRSGSAIPPRFFVTPWPLLMLISVSLTSHRAPWRCGRSPPRTPCDRAVRRRRLLALLVVRRALVRLRERCTSGTRLREVLDSLRGDVVLVDHGRPVVVGVVRPCSRSRATPARAWPCYRPCPASPSRCVITLYVLTAFAMPATATAATTTASVTAMQKLSHSSSWG